MKRGRPKGRSRDSRSFGPLGDLIRKARLEKELGLADVAKACGCSVQFISNIEHGRAPLPWDKLTQLASFLKIAVSDLQAANLAIRSDFRSFVQVNSTGRTSSVRGKRVPTPAILQGVTGAASAVALTARDSQLLAVLRRYQDASPVVRKKFVATAMKMLPAQAK